MVAKTSETSRSSYLGSAVFRGEGLVSIFPFMLQPKVQCQVFYKPNKPTPTLNSPSGLLILILLEGSQSKTRATNN